MRKIFKKCGVLALCSVLLVSTSLTTVQAKTLRNNGLTLDVARKYYSVKTILKYIEQLAKHKNTYLHLHLSDDQNFGVESKTLGLIPKKRKAVNPITKKKYLTKSEIKKIVSYAKKKKVTVIPEIDTPSHMSNILALLKRNNPKLAKSISLSPKNDKAWNTLDYSKKASIQFVEKLYAEYLPLFSKQSRKAFHIGGDEFTVYPKASDTTYVKYVNTLNRFLRKKGFTTQVWNDGFYKKDLKKFDKNIQITYWSQIGCQNLYANTKEANLSRKYIANADQLLKAGFGVYNYNGYYLYLLAGNRTFKKQALDYTIWDIRTNWTINQFELNSGDRTAVSSKILGSAMTIWGEEAHNVSETKIYNHSIKMLHHFMKRVKLQ